MLQRSGILPGMGKKRDQSGLTESEKRAARRLMRAEAMKQEAVKGARGRSPASLEALARSRPPAPFKLGPRCEGKNKRGEPCGLPAIRGATHCHHHGGHLEAPTSPASRRWWLRTGRTIEERGRATVQLRSQSRDATQEERYTVWGVMPRRVAGGRLGYFQLLCQGIAALRAFRDGTDPLAWQRFTLHAAQQAALMWRNPQAINQKHGEK